MPRVRERTRSFDRETEIDCRNWLKFTIVEETYRHHRIRFTEFDKEKAKPIECNLTPEKDRQQDPA